MAFKIVVLAAVVMALWHGVAAEKCESRGYKRLENQLRGTTRCKRPQESLVQLPVPERFDYVVPSVVKLQQCTGLTCNNFPEKCLPMSGTTTTKTYNVTAYNVEYEKTRCEQVTVEEHSACECRCEIIDCPFNQVYNEHTCECDCNQRMRTTCMQKRNHRQVMWSETSCSCLCDHHTECDSSMIWDQELCMCILKETANEIW